MYNLRGGYNFGAMSNEDRLTQGHLPWTVLTDHFQWDEVLRKFLFH